MVRRSARFLWRCKGCKKQFTVRAGTIMEDSPIPLRFWCLAFYRACASKKGISALQIKRETGLSYKSALFMMHRIRYAMAPAAPAALEGIVEIDETLVGGKGKERKRKEGKRIAKGTRDNKTTVLAMVERGGNVRTQIIPNRTAPVLKPVIRRMVKASSRIMTDEWVGYRGLNAIYASHETVNHSAVEYARGDVTTNTIEGFFAIVKRGIYGTFPSVSKKYLDRYMSEFEFRYNHRKMDDGARTVAAIQAYVSERASARTRPHRRRLGGRG